MVEGKPKFSEDRDLLLDQIGRRVIARRKQLGLTQTELAARLEVTVNNVGRIERAEANLTVGTLCRVAEALETTVQELMFGGPARR